jgi:hypothetical protein
MIAAGALIVRYYARECLFALRGPALRDNECHEERHDRQNYENPRSDESRLFFLSNRATPAPQHGVGVKSCLCVTRPGS